MRGTAEAYPGGKRACLSNKTEISNQIIILLVFFWFFFGRKLSQT